MSSLVHAKPILDATDSFLSYLRVERGVSGNTLSAYRTDLTQFADFLQKCDRIESIAKIDESSVMTYVLQLVERGFSETTRARKIASMRSFFAFLVDEGILQVDPCENVSTPRLGRSLPTALSEEEVERLLDTPSGSNPADLRDRAMLELMYAAGLRVSELVGLDYGDFDLEGGAVRPMGKGGKERLVPVHQVAIKVMASYMRSGRPKMVNERTDRAIFLGATGTRLTRQGFWHILRKRALQAEISTKLSPHTLRHSFATHLLLGGAPLRHVQELLGHASLTTTQIYTHITAEHVRFEYDRAHPRSS